MIIACLKLRSRRRGPAQCRGWFCQRSISQPSFHNARWASTGGADVMRAHRRWITGWPPSYGSRAWTWIAGSKRQAEKN